MVITDKQLIDAVLAMDSYNRGYDSKFAENEVDKVGLGTTKGIQIGNVKILDQSNVDDGSPEFQASFYAIAYENISTGEKIISYRGTNDALDVVTGWTLGAGVYFNTQAQLTAEFYNTVIGAENPFDANISLVGHSLGGGLAGMMASLYGKEATIFDNMPFEFASSLIYGLADSGDSATLGNYYFNGATPQLPNNLNIDAYATTGEVLAAIRELPATQTTPVEYIDSKAVYAAQLTFTAKHCSYH